MPAESYTPFSIVFCVFGDGLVSPAAMLSITLLFLPMPSDLPKAHPKLIWQRSLLLRLLAILGAVLRGIARQ